MDSSLPSSIAAYLQEADFSGTEIAVIRKLLEGDSLTLRELSTKTSKSTGVLDQAVKKLLKKGLVTREMINETPRYSLLSVQTVVDWMKEDMLLKQEMLVRKHQNLESFVRSLTVTEKKRPEMEFFEGLEAVKNAYMRLLERGNDIVQYGPVLWAAKEDPLHAFWVEYFRERRRRGIFSRVLTNDTPQGRRYQSRDPFEYRKTILVDRSEFPFPFEKIIIGDTLGCFQLEDERACFIRYPELAQDERIFFERIWNRQVQQSAPQPVQNDSPPREYQEAILISSSQPSLYTRTLSQVREFFLSRTSIATLAIFGIFALLFSTALYRANVARNVQSIREQALSVAADAAVQFDPADLAVLRTIDDIRKPEYKKVIYQLNLIRNRHPDVTYAYILRPTDDPALWEFVADADSLDPFAIEDLNGDGLINAADHLSPPGEKYDAAQLGISRNLSGPMVSTEPYQDQWGTWYSGFAPIRNVSNELVAIVGIDVGAGEANRLPLRVLWLITAFVCIFGLMVFARLLIFHQSLWRNIRQDLGYLLNPRGTSLLMSMAAIVAILLTTALYIYDVNMSIERIRERVTSIAVTAAMQFSPQELAMLQTRKDAARGEYRAIVERLYDIRMQNKEIMYVYLIRPREDTTTFEFIADADAFGVALNQTVDTNKDGIIDPSDEYGYPGLPYDIAHISVLKERRFMQPVATKKPYTDKWGTILTGYAPIRNVTGQIEGLLAVDVDAQDIYDLRTRTFAPFSVFILFFFGALVLRSSLFWKIAGLSIFSKP